MDWSSELGTLRSELDSFRRDRDQRIILEEAERQERLPQLKDLLLSLDIEATLSEMNRLLLDRRGDLKVYAPWDLQDEVEEGSEDAQDEDEEMEYEGDSVSAILTWEEEGTREIAVDLVMAGQRFYLQVNGTEVRRLEQDDIRKALIQAFKEELGF